MHGLKHMQSRVNLSMPSKRAQSLQQDREDRQRGGRQVGGRVKSVRGRELAQPTIEQPTPQCPAPYLPCRTSDHQEAGGVLERVESRRQGAVGTEPGLQEKSAGKDPQGRVLGSGSLWQKCFQEA